MDKAFFFFNSEDNDMDRLGGLCCPLRALVLSQCHPMPAGLHEDSLPKERTPMAQRPSASPVLTS